MTLIHSVTELFRRIEAVTYDLTRPFRSILYSQPLTTCFILMGMFIIICFLPLICFGDEYNQAFLKKSPNLQLYYECNYEKWLLVSILVTAPMLIEWVLDRKQAVASPAELSQWISRIILIIALFGPNLVMLCVLSGPKEAMNPYLAQLQLSLFYSQQIVIIGSLFCTMFFHRMENVHNVEDRLGLSVEHCTIHFLLMLVIGKLILFIAILDKSYYYPCTIVACIVIVLAILQAVIVLIVLLKFLWRQTIDLAFQSHEHMSDFYHLLAILLFLISDFTCISLSQQVTDINPKTFQCHKHNCNFVQFTVRFLYIQVGLTFFLTVIPSRCYALLAEIKQAKLTTRLNLIRYVSHEMRTPLNTAFLGLGMLSTEIQAVKDKINKLSTGIFRNNSRSNTTDNQDTYSIINLSTAHTIQGLSPLPANRHMFGSFTFANLDTRNTGNNTTAAGPAQQRRVQELLQNVLSMEDLEDMMDTVRQVQDSCKVALETLNDLLTFDKLDENKLVIEVDEIEPYNFVLEAAKPFEINAKQGDITFSVSCKDADEGWTRLAFIKADKFKLSQVLRNLCSNALKFTLPHGTVEVSIAMIAAGQSQYLGRDAGTALRVSVTDSGAGISIENQRKLFGQYVQFNAAALQQGKGSGLGLWISKSIVEMHGGKIWALSEGEGKGSTFGIDLPLFLREDDEPANPRLLNLMRNAMSRRFILPNNMSAGGFHPNVSEPSLLNHRVTFAAGSSNNSSSFVNNNNDRDQSKSYHSLVPKATSSDGPAQLTLHRASSSRLIATNAVAPHEKTIPQQQQEQHDSLLQRLEAGQLQLIASRDNIPQQQQTSKENGESNISGGYGTLSFGFETSHLKALQRQSHGGQGGQGQTQPSQQCDEPQLWTNRVKQLFSPPKVQPVNVHDNVSLVAANSGGGGSTDDALRPLPTNINLPNINTASSKHNEQSFNPHNGHSNSSSMGATISSMTISTRRRASDDESNPLNLLDSVDNNSSNGLSFAQQPPRVKKDSRSPDHFSRKAIATMASNESVKPSSPYQVADNSKEQEQDQFLAGKSRSKSGGSPMISRAITIDANMNNAAANGDNNDEKEDFLFEKQLSPMVIPFPAVNYDHDHSKLQQEPLLSSATTTLPSSSAALQQPHPRQQAQTKHIARPRRWENGLNILIVDDTLSNRKIMRKILTSAGHTVNEAYDGQDCLDKLSSLPDVEVILMDEHMPRMNGPEATKELLRRGFTGVVFAITGAVTEEEIKHFKACGATAVLPKPLNVDSLRQAVNTYFIAKETV